MNLCRKTASIFYPCQSLSNCPSFLMPKNAALNQILPSLPPIFTCLLFYTYSTALDHLSTKEASRATFSILRCRYFTFMNPPLIVVPVQSLLQIEEQRHQKQANKLFEDLPACMNQNLTKEFFHFFQHKI